jgi:Tfp pilus assembly protein PilE
VNRWICYVFGVIPVLGILAAIIIPAYQAYAIRSQVQEGLALADPAVTCVTRSYQTSKTVPPDTAACGLPTHIGNELVDGVDIGDNGVVTITFSSYHLKNATLLFTPYVEENGGIAWTCSEGGTLPTIYRPAKCRT